MTDRTGDEPQWQPISRLPMLTGHAEQGVALSSVNNLAGAYQSAGDLGRAIPLYEQALADCRASPGRCASDDCCRS